MQTNDVISLKKTVLTFAVIRVCIEIIDARKNLSKLFFGVSIAARNTEISEKSAVKPPNKPAEIMPAMMSL